MASLLDFLNPFRAIETVRSVASEFSTELTTRSSIVPPPRSASAGVAPVEAVSIAAVYRGVSILSNAIKQIGVHLYRDDVRLESTPIWVKQPDDKITRAEFMARTVNSMAVAGNAYWRVSRNGRGETVKLEVLNPFDMMINSTDSGELTGYTYRGTTDYAINEIQHLKMLAMPGNLYGLGPIQACQAELRNAKDTRDFASKWFSDSGMAAQVVSPKVPVSPDTLIDIAESLRNAQTGGSVVAPTELSIQNLFLNPRDAMFVEVQQWNTAQVCRILGIPANMMLAEAGSSMTYSNVEQEQIAFTRYSLSAYYVEIEQAMSALLPRGTDARMNIDALLRNDTLTRYQAHQIAIAAGFKTIDEVREDEKLAPLLGVPDGTI
jgi:HK97 family phage portal protein